MHGFKVALIASAALASTQAQAAIRTAVITGSVGSLSPFVSPTPTGAFAGVTGPFTATLKYDTDIFQRTAGGGFAANTDRNSYNALVGGELSVSGVTYTGRNYYQAMSYSTPATSAKGGYAAISFSYNFFSPDERSQYLMHFFLYGEPDAFAGTTKESILFGDALESANFINRQSSGSSLFLGATGSLMRFDGTGGSSIPAGQMSLAPEMISVSNAVPEPATWAMMLVGFGMIGATARYRRRSITTTYA